MSTLARFLLIVLLAGIGPLLAQNGGRTDSSRAASTIDNTPPGTLNPQPAYTEVVKTAAEDPSVTRIFVNAAIKKEMCSEVGTDRHWLAKVRPWWGHSEHFH